MFLFCFLHNNKCTTQITLTFDLCSTFIFDIQYSIFTNYNLTNYTAVCVCVVYVYHIENIYVYIYILYALVALILIGIYIVLLRYYSSLL